MDQRGAEDDCLAESAFDPDEDAELDPFADAGFPSRSGAACLGLAPDVVAVSDVAAFVALVRSGAACRGFAVTLSAAAGAPEPSAAACLGFGPFSVASAADGLEADPPSGTGVLLGAEIVPASVFVTDSGPVVDSFGSEAWAAPVASVSTAAACSCVAAWPTV